MAITITIELGQSATWVNSRPRPPRGPIAVGAK